MGGRKGKSTGGAGWSLTRECPDCGRPQPQCRCAQPTDTLPPERQLARLRLEKRRGKPITVVAGLVLSAVDARALLREIRGLCGAGGTLRGAELEVQGDQRRALGEFLTQKGFRVRGV